MRATARVCVRVCVNVHIYECVCLYSLRLTQAIQLNLAVIIVPTPFARGVFVEVDAVFAVEVVRLPGDPGCVGDGVFTVHPEPRAVVKYVGPAQPHALHGGCIKG